MVKRNCVGFSFAAASLAAVIGCTEGQTTRPNNGVARIATLRAEHAKRGELLRDGNYAMFIHWGLYSHLGNRWKDKTYYGIGEWIMHPRMAGIPIDEYKGIAAAFNPVKFNARQIAELARDAGMKYIVITAKHHDGFAMYRSRADPFNIADATPYKQDPMKALAEACRETGIGLGFYYSHNQDWTAPGGSGGPKTRADGKPATFDDYYREKCLPQVKEITSGYGPIEIVWFDTPGSIPEKYVKELVQVVRENQPKALISGRAGYGLGDYVTLGDMEVPHQNVDGLWESVDTTNDSWAYAWYDQNWKTPREILHRLIACVARGGTYMLNIGPRGDGSIPERAAGALRDAGRWIARYPQVIYGTDASPWQHVLPWGDVTVRGSTLYLCVFTWPASGRLHLPGLKTEVTSAALLTQDGTEALSVSLAPDWVVLDVPARAPEQLVSVIQLDLAGPPEADPTWGLDPEVPTEILVDFASVEGAKKLERRWMEKFGEWKHVARVSEWKGGGKAAWEIAVLAPGDYQVDLTYAGSGRLVWGVDVEGGEHIQNEQNASHNYQAFPIGWIRFPKPGRYRIAASCLEGEQTTASLTAIRLAPID